MNNYHEPFLGGGSVLLYILSMKRESKIIIHGNIKAYDINPLLIDMYVQLQSNKDKLYERIIHYRDIYDSLPATCDAINRNPTTIEEARLSKENYYYWMRKEFNMGILATSVHGPITSAALFIFLNKTCFRGLYREGPNGFNVPYGHYKKTPYMITKVDIDNISDLIQPVEFIACDFKDAFKCVCPGDFMYLDPPYVPETATSFVGYTKDGFNLDMHGSLFEEIKKLPEKVGRFVLSNANVPLVRETFKDAQYKCKEIIAKRSINSLKPDTMANEVLIYMG